jgi:tetratricopeptide (TPR) repeat protein
MAAPLDQSGESSPDTPPHEAGKRRLREQSQIDFELEFLGRILEREPFFVAALKVHAGNLAATGQYARALQIDRRLVRLVPEDPITWYNLACSFAVLGMIDPAFGALQKALETGYRTGRRLRRDPDLKALRRDPRFARLLRRFGFVVN